MSVLSSWISCVALSFIDSDFNSRWNITGKSQYCGTQKKNVHVFVYSKCICVAMHYMLCKQKIHIWPSRITTGDSIVIITTTLVICLEVMSNSDHILQIAPLKHLCPFLLTSNWVFDLWLLGHSGFYFSVELTLCWVVWIGRAYKSPLMQDCKHKKGLHCLCFIIVARDENPLLASCFHFDNNDSL